MKREDIPLHTALRDICEAVSPPFRDLDTAEIIRRSKYGDEVCSQLEKYAQSQLVSEHNKHLYRENQIDGFAKAFCPKGHAMVDAFLKGRGTKPSKTSIAKAVSDDAVENRGGHKPKNGIPTSKDSLNTLANKALDAERLERLGLTNPLHRI